MAGRPIGIGAKLKQQPSLDLDRPYPMTHAELGHAIIINNLRSQAPDTVSDVHALRAALETVGFNVKCYDDCNVQDMRKIKNWTVKQEVHQDMNSFGLIILCQKINQGWILDRYQRRAFTIEQLASGLSGVKTLHRKPKFIVIQESGEDGEVEDIPVLDNKEDFYIVSTSCDSDSATRSYIRELAAMLEEHYLEEPLRRIFWMTKQNLSTPQQISSDLKESELMTLAGKISSTAMQIIAVQKLGFGISEVETLEAATRENQWMMKFKLLDRWKNRNRRNSRQKLIAILHEASNVEGILDSNLVDKVLKTGGMGALSTKEFDSFTHVLYFSEFYKDRNSEATPGESYRSDPEVIRQIKKLQEKIEKLTQQMPGRKLYELKLVSTHDIGIRDWSDGFTVMPQSGDLVVSGRDDVDDPWSLLVFSLKDGKLKETNRISSSCGHSEGTCTSPLIIDGKEKLVVSCYECDDLKLLDLQTGGWSTAFPGCKPWCSCSGGSSTIFIQPRIDQSILELDATSSVIKGPIRTLHTDILCGAMCYIPPPVHSLLLRDLNPSKSMVALSVEKDEATWQFENNPRFPCLLFHPGHNVLLVTGDKKATVQIVNPGNGSLIQTIHLPDTGFILEFGLYKNQIVMLHNPNHPGFKISYCDLLG